MRRFEKQQAIKLRIQGKSYNEIRKILNIPSKGTLSYWFRDLKLPLSAITKLANKIKMANERGLFQYNRDRTEAIQLENTKECNFGKMQIGKISKRELLLIGAALYWGEGQKSERVRNVCTVGLANSDPKLIGLYLRFVREVLEIDDRKIRPSILVHHNVNITQAKKFWSVITGLPMEQFNISFQISRASKFKRPKRLLPYGTVDIRIHRRPLFHRVKGYISGLAANI